MLWADCRSGEFPKLKASALSKQEHCLGQDGSLPMAVDEIRKLVGH